MNLPFPDKKEGQIYGALMELPFGVRKRLARIMCPDQKFNITTVKEVNKAYTENIIMPLLEALRDRR